MWYPYLTILIAKYCKILRVKMHELYCAFPNKVNPSVSYAG